MDNHLEIEEFENDYYVKMIFERLFNQFQMSWKYLIDLDFLFLYRMHIPPSQLDDMEFYRLELLIEKYNQEIEKENREKEAQRAKEERDSKKMKSSYKTPKLK